MVRACGRYRGEERCLQETSRKEDHLEDLGIDWRKVLEWILKK
jgi:hypothetical protein